MQNYLLIPDINNVEKSVELASKYGLKFEYNEFTRPEIYSDEAEVDRVINTYKSLERDRSNDTMHGAFLGVDIAAVDPALKEYSQKLCKQSLEIANKLGIKGVVFHTGLIGTLRVEYYVNNWLDTAEDFFGKLCRKYPDIEIYMENSFEQEPDVFISLMDRMREYNNFKLCLDYGHAVLTQTSVEKWVEAFAPFIGHMHLNDNDLEDDLHLALGTGQIDFNEYSLLMRKYGIESSVLLEMNGYDKVEKSIRFIKKLEDSETEGIVKAAIKSQHKCADNKKLQKILDIGIALSKERDPDELLSAIVDTAMEITNCDGGSLYVLKDDGLHFAVMKTKSKGVNRVFAEHFFGSHEGDTDEDNCTDKMLLPPIPFKEENVCAYTAIHKKSLNIEDVYDSSLFDFSGPKSNDKKNNYRTKSMVTIPMINHRDEVIGVMQLLNAMDENSEIISFSDDDERIISSLASQTAICLSNMIFMKELDKQIWSFTEALTEAIDMRTPYNGNHTKHVAKYVEMIADYINDLHDKGEEELSFSDEHKAQIVMAAYLHDIGKMITPVKVMNKETRLQHQIKEIEYRFLIAKLNYEIALLRGNISEDEYKKFISDVEFCDKLSHELNSDKPLSDEQEKLIEKATEMSYIRWEDENTKNPFFYDDEIACMRIKHGTLTDEERQIMQDHVVITEKILEKVYFNRSYKMAPVWASQHHECLNGSGYPKNLTAENIGIEARMLAVADICDALLATDRPYKKTMPKEKAFAIMKDMANFGKLDMKCVEYLEACIE